MLTRATVRHFQSIEKADLALHPFTVIVGASNSGKSAFLRALRTLAYNTTSPGIVQVGHDAAVVSLKWEDKCEPHEVWVERGPSKSTYGTVIDHKEERFPKAGVSVPDDVAKILRFPEVEGDSLNFSFQFDKPFLLDVPGTKVAKILGDLTNINVLYEAVREANRRKLEASSKLKVRRSDEADLSERMAEFGTLPEEKRSLVACEAIYLLTVSKQADVDRLAALVEQSELIEGRVQELRASCGASPLPDMGVLDSRIAEAVSLRGLLQQITFDGQQRAEMRTSLASETEDVARLEADFENALHDSGSCPLCGAVQ